MIAFVSDELNGIPAQWIKTAITTVVQKYIREGEKDFIIGCATGIDAWVAEEVIRQGGRIHLYVSHRNFARNWPEQKVEKFHAIVEHATSYKIATHNPYEPWITQKHSAALVDKCTRLVIIWKGTAGNTRDCLAYAEQNSKHITAIDPIRGIVWEYIDPGYPWHEYDKVL